MNEEKDWFEEGLQFTCTQCGNCCVGDPGAVWVTREEERSIAQNLKLPLRTFRSKYITKIEGEPSLVEVPSKRGQHCVFLQEGKKGCEIYPVRPRQCRTWPFWPENLRSFRNWIDATKYCPGMAKGLEGSGEFYSAKEIRKIRDHTPADPESYEV